MRHIADIPFVGRIALLQKLQSATRMARTRVPWPRTSRSRTRVQSDGSPVQRMIASGTTSPPFWIWQRRSRRPERESEPQALPAPSPTPARSRRRLGEYVLVGLFSLAAGWLLHTPFVPQHRASLLLQPDTSVSVPPERDTDDELPALSSQATVERLIKSGVSASATSPCEWVRAYTRKDGVRVAAHYRSRPGHAGECSSGNNRIAHKRTADQPVHVGPRGGRYHYSASGKKVYERRRR